MKRLLGGECIVCNSRKFEFDAAFNRKPMQLRQQTTRWKGSEGGA
jgi:hypothetical protein